LAHAGRARLRVFDVSGRRVATLLDRDLAAGRHSAFWSGRDDEGRPVASGVYLYRVEAPGFTQTRKMALLK
jgi:flagellar hook assembly protein FlgD